MNNTWCIYYTGIYGRELIKHECCDAGVRYDDVRGKAKPYRWPCTTPQLKCDKREYPTPEQVAEEERAFEEEWKAISTVRALIVDEAKRSGSPVKVECPKCLDTLHGSVASNGHVHAQCATEGCLHWME